MRTLHFVDKNDKAALVNDKNDNTNGVLGQNLPHQVSYSRFPFILTFKSKHTDNQSVKTDRAPFHPPFSHVPHVLSNLPSVFVSAYKSVTNERRLRR